MPKKNLKKKPKSIIAPVTPEYDAVLTSVVSLLEFARRTSARAVNVIMTATYWQIGQRIVEHEQGGGHRAAYGKQLLQRLSHDLTARFGRGFSVDNLEQMRRFYEAYPTSEISETASRKLPPSKSEALSRISSPTPDRTAFPLPWSHYVRLLSVEKAAARRFYEAEALRGGWSVRQLDRQIATQFYERTLMSKDKAAMLRKGQIPRREDAVTAEEEVKDPFLLEFLGLKDEYSESDLEEALIQQLETFLLELGGDFTFVGRQRRLRIGDTWYRVDLLFFHRRLRCLVVIDLKVGKFTHADAGQMHLYLNYAAEHWTHPEENPPVGLILCTQKNAAVAHYTLDNLPNKVLAAEYRTTLPDEGTLVMELEKTRRRLEAGTASPSKPDA